MFGKLSAVEIEEVIRHQIVGRIGCHADDVTYVVPISYAYDGDCVYAHSFEGLKIDMMRKNPKVCFQTDVMHSMGNWQSVIAWGEFEELEKSEQRNDALKILVARALPVVSSETTHLTPDWPFPSTEAGDIKGIVFRIKLTSKTGRFEQISPVSTFAS